MAIKHRLKNYSLILLLAVVFFILLIAGGIYKYNWQGRFVLNLSKIIPYPALLVDWEIVRYATFLENMSALERYWQTQKENGNVLAAIPDKAEMRSLLIEKTIENKIIQIFARQKGISVTAEEIDKEWQTITASKDLQTQVYDFLSKAYGWSDTQFKKKVLSNYLLRQKAVAFLHGQSGLDEAELLARALEIEGKIKAGESFAALASQYSADAVTKINGGETGYFSVGSWPPPLEKAILQLKIGQVSSPVLFDSAYYLFKLEDLLYNDKGLPAQMNIRQIVLNGFDFTAWLEEQKQNLSIYRFL